MLKLQLVEVEEDTAFEDIQKMGAGYQSIEGYVHRLIDR